MPSYEQYGRYGDSRRAQKWGAMNFKADAAQKDDISNAHQNRRNRYQKIRSVHLPISLRRIGR